MKRFAFISYILILAMLITNTEPHSYVSVGKLTIRDDRGKLFYYYPGPEQHSFNLPRGNYRIMEPCQVTQLDEFTPDAEIEDCIHLPTAYRGMQIGVGENINKASYYPHFNKAVVDPKVAQHEFEPCTMACLCHEEGHTDIRSGPGYPLSFFQAEHFCDCYGYNKMVKNGYNSIQAELAFELLLDEDNPRVPALKRKVAIANGKGTMLPEAPQNFNCKLPVIS